MKTKQCTKCKDDKPISEFHYKKTENRRHSWCKACLYDHQKKRWTEQKVKALEELGAKCTKCGYDKNAAALHFHHLDPREKDVSWGKLRLRSWDKIKKEIEKCVVLCANCHAEEHYPQLNK